ncbi:CvpA family protein [Mycoplasma tauri]|uniref:CvpA family protein n=1 Tax=Mycoplasma tauri TaxID=547987 RepID=UPI001CBF7F53|nr:CvpA family protein [Mycoplasma tauri]MBZ4218152.1 hypothetical protein [Mycoplasma tauri]
MIENWESFAFNPWSALIPVLLVIFVFIFAIISGLRRGIIGGIIVMSFGLVGWIIALLICISISNTIVNIINEKFLNNEGYNIEVIKPLICGILMFLIQISFLIIGEIITLCFKKRIKNKFKNRKDNNVSSLSYRSLGAVLSSIGVIPCSILTANISGIVSTNNPIIDANDTMLKAISFNQAKGISKYTPGIIGGAYIADESTTKKSKNDDSEKTTISSAASYYINQMLNPSNYVLKIDFDFEKNGNKHRIVQFISADGKVLSSNNYYDENDTDENRKKFEIFDQKFGIDSKIYFQFDANKNGEFEFVDHEKESNKLTPQSEKLSKIFRFFTYSEESFSLFETVIINLAKQSLNDLFNVFYDKIQEIDNHLKDSGAQISDWVIKLDGKNFDESIRKLFKFNIANGTKIQVSSQKYINKLKNIFVKIMKENEKISNTDNQLDEENIKKKDTINSATEKVYLIMSAFINNLFISKE